MENHISVQLIQFGRSILLGIALGLLYDLFRAFRLRHSRAAGLWDVLYCLTALTFVFLFLLRCTEGQLRFYMLLGIAGGGGLHFCCFSRILRPLWDFWVENLTVYVRILSIPERLSVRFCNFFSRRCKYLFYFAGKCYTIKKTGGFSGSVIHKRGGGHGAQTEKEKNKGRVLYETPASAPAGSSELAVAQSADRTAGRQNPPGETSRAGRRKKAGKPNSSGGNRLQRKQRRNGANRKK
jgi:spore cortex biosynthesis protein YabQ